MSEAVAEGDAPGKASKLPLILGVVLALAGGTGGYLAVSAGLLPFVSAGTEKSPETMDGAVAQKDSDGFDPPGIPDVGDFSFVELPPIIISLGPGAFNTHLRFRATLEVPAAYADEVATLTPRIVDAMNGYLRALSPSDIEAQDALLMIRSQLTRRVELVLGREKLNDLLVLEFVLN